MAEPNTLPDDLTKLKVVELREELEQRGLDGKGLKKDLVDRLQRALDDTRPSDAELPTDEQKDLAEPIPSSSSRETGGGGELAAIPVKPAADVALMTGDGGEAGTTEEAVGHSMVEGAEEVAQEIEDRAEAVVTTDDLLLEPAVLDPQVARVVAKEEAKADLPPTPSPPPRASPRPDTPPPAAESSKKRGASRSPSPSKRRRMSVSASRPATPEPPAVPLPRALSHLLHPPTRVLHIANLRRPLLLPSLHEYLFTDDTPHASPASSPISSTQRPFTSAEHPGVWLAGVKDHAYAAYASTEDAIEAAERIEGDVWPEHTGGKLRVQFIPEREVGRLIEEEEEAWAAARQKLELRIREEGGKWVFEVVGPNGQPRARARATAAQGAAPYAPRGGRGVPGAPSGPSKSNGMGRGVAPPRGPALSIRGRGDGGVGARTAGRAPVLSKRTQTRPVLMWREGPGAAA